MSQHDEGSSPYAVIGIITLVVAGLLSFGLLSTPTQPAPDPAALASVTPGPTRQQEARPRRLYALADHPVLATGVELGRTSCDLPTFDKALGPLLAYYEAAVRCFDRQWQPVLAKLNLPFTSVKVDASETLGETPCGRSPAKDEAIALYCPVNETIYMPRDRLLPLYSAAQRPWVYLLSVLAHEYGHHVQSVSGMLIAAWDEVAGAGGTGPLALELQRRQELQATCLGGLSIWAVSDGGSLVKAYSDLTASGRWDTSGSSDTHGSGSSNATWAGRGYRGRATANCNTWPAPAAEVR
ncbi:neutral zinc metallopeptidase [Allokutzneria sp. NRRL B-24872]|uniref:neutral zinc metallopeptidase n=1 Tax=Allokutzneria sp. NRRL B-24872 TaxID=1137961 RepID=UPI00143D8CCB|nr:neutral zinc metallopeptidase [Allokutzneria sp. NRRL B-24872]